MSGRPSPHVLWRELACSDGTEYPHEWREDRLPPLLRIFEGVREIWGKPITISSAYRTPAYNRRIGGARRSQHPEGRAIDLHPPAGVPLRIFHTEARRVAQACGATGIGIYLWGVHIDTRPSERLVTWRSAQLELGRVA